MADFADRSLAGDMWRNGDFIYALMIVLDCEIFAWIGSFSDIKTTKVEIFIG